MEVGEGDWENFSIQTVKDATDIDNVLLHLRESFYKDETSQKVHGMTEARANDLDKRIRGFVEKGMSLMAVDKSTHKIAGVLIKSPHSSTDPPPVELTPTSPITPLVRGLQRRLDESVNIFQTFGVDKYGNIFIVSVSQEYRRLGLATELYRRGISILKKMGFPLIISDFSHPGTRRIGEKLGFKEIARIRYVDAVDEEGNLCATHFSPDEFIMLSVLDLRNTQTM